MTRYIFEREGMVVLYGDTDSLFVKSSWAGTNPDELEKEVEAALSVFHKHISDVGFGDMELRIESSGSPSRNSYVGAVLIDKKMYILLTAEGTNKANGVSIRRKDRPNIVNEAYERCARAVVRYGVGDIAALVIHKCLVETLSRIGQTQ